MVADRGRVMFPIGIHNQKEPSTLLNGLDAWFTFDEASGNILDSSGNGYTHTEQNGVSRTTGKINGCSTFNGSNDWYQRGSSQFPWNCSADWTIAVWVRPQSSSRMSIITSTQNTHGFNLECNTTYSPRLNVYAAGWKRVNLPTNTLSFNTWGCIIAWLDVSGRLAYITHNNGTPSSVSTQVNPNVSTSQSSIGAYNGGQLGYWWNGEIDEMGIWNRILTADERTEYYNSGNGIGFGDL